MKTAYPTLFHSTEEVMNKIPVTSFKRFEVHCSPPLLGGATSPFLRQMPLPNKNEPSLLIKMKHDLQKDPQIKHENQPQNPAKPSTIHADLLSHSSLQQPTSLILAA
jgi:hypothetical protein